MNEERQRRLAQNEALARDVNEVVEGVAASWYGEEERLEFRCECVRPSCRDHVSLTRAEYRSVRTDPTRFVVVPGHEELEVEREVGRIRDYVVVEKTGAGMEVAEETAPED